MKYLENESSQKENKNKVKNEKERKVEKNWPRAQKTTQAVRSEMTTGNRRNDQRVGETNLKNKAESQVNKGSCWA